MMHIVGAEQAAGVAYREDFRGASFFFHNGGRLFNDAFIDRDGFDRGSTGYATIEIPPLKTDGFTFILRFIPQQAWDINTQRYLFDTELLNRTFRVALLADNRMFIEVDGTTLFAVFGGGGTWSDNWVVGQETTMIVSASPGNSFFALNGFVTTSATSYVADGQIRQTFLNVRTDVAFPIDNIVQEVSFIGHAIGTDDEPAVRNGAIIADIRSDQSLVTLPLERDYAFGGIQSTPLEGMHKAVLQHAQLGNGVTSTTFPTKLDRRAGYSFDGGDYITIADHPSLTFSDGGGVDTPFTIAVPYMIASSSGTRFLVRKGVTAGVDREYLFFTIGDRALIGAYDASGNYVGRSTATGFGTFAQNAVVTAIVTYDGSKANSGFRIYADGIQVDTSNFSSGAYAGMSALGSDFELGQVILGDIYGCSVYRSWLSPIQVRAFTHQLQERATI